MKKPKKSAATRAHVLACALELFRQHGFDRTTMRDIARRAGLALGAAYYYFPSKQAIVQAFYEERQRERAATMHATFAAAKDAPARLRALFFAEVDSMARDRKLFVALARGAVDPDDPASVFSRKTRGVRQSSLALFAEALAPAGLAEPIAGVMARALWLLDLGLHLYFVHDRSRGQTRTRRLVDDALALVTPLLAFATAPAAQALAAPLAKLLERASLL